MEFSVQSSAKLNSALFVVPLFQNGSWANSSPKNLASIIKKREEEKDFLASEGEMLLLLPDDKNFPSRIILWGLGEKKKLTPQKIRGLAAQLVKSLRHFKKPELGLWIPDDVLHFGQELGEGLTFGNYNPAKFKTGKEKEELELQNIRKIFVTMKKKAPRFEEEIKKGAVIAEAVGEIRDMVNAGPALKNVDYIVKKSQEIADENGYKITVLNKDEMKKMGMGGIIGVNAGSELGAKMVLMEYVPKGTAQKPPVVMIGKGIIFDSGGYNLKSSHSLHEMQLDMAGAGAVIGTFSLLKKLGIHQRVVGIFPLTDNLVSATSQKPSDIVTTYSGKTVEILNTDAEGRMVLCDAISYAVRHYHPRYVIDIATLTGACMVALGDRYAGLFGNDGSLIEKIRKAGEQVDELSWPMPIHQDHKLKMKSKIADLRNWDEVPYAAASKAAAFLEEFVENAKWAHLDIAGPAFVKDPKKYESMMGTGFGVRLMLQFLENLR